MSGGASSSAPARSFASDNNAGVHPEVLAAIARANVGHVRAYGDDPWTERALAALRAHFGPETRAHIVFNGTGANVLALQALTQPFHAIVCPRTAHIAVDECGAPERFTGCKLIELDTPDGKLRPADVEPVLHVLGDQHHSQPRVVSISNSTELGTLYRPEELRALAGFCHARGLFLHVDGARLANAAAALGTSMRALSTDAGVDVLSFGGTKNGLLGAEAVLFLRAEGEALDADFRFLRKSATQLPSKMRFLAAQLEALFEPREGGELWRRNAAHANAMARRLAEGVRTLANVRLTQPVEANGVFAVLPKDAIPRLQEQSFFYVWDPAAGEVRWMCSFDTTEDDVDRFVGRLRELVG